MALYEELVDLVMKRLTMLNDQDRAANAFALDALDNLMPYSNAWGEVGRTFMRVSEVSNLIEQERLAGRLRAWVMPSAAALAFEPVMQSCVTYWASRGLLRGDAAKGGTIDDTVTEYVARQVHLFVSLLGGEVPDLSSAKGAAQGARGAARRAEA